MHWPLVSGTPLPKPGAPPRGQEYLQQGQELQDDLSHRADHGDPGNRKTHKVGTQLLPLNFCCSSRCSSLLPKKGDTHHLTRGSVFTRGSRLTLDREKCQGFLLG